MYEKDIVNLDKDSREYNNFLRQKEDIEREDLLLRNESGSTTKEETSPPNFNSCPKTNRKGWRGSQTAREKKYFFLPSVFVGNQ